MDNRTAKLAAAAAVIMIVLGGVTFWPAGSSKNGKWWLGSAAVYGQEILAEMEKIENFLEHLPTGGDKSYAVKRRRVHESRLFDVEDLLERLESYTYDQDT